MDQRPGVVVVADVNGRPQVGVNGWRMCEPEGWGVHDLPFGLASSQCHAGKAYT